MMEKSELPVTPGQIKQVVELIDQKGNTQETMTRRLASGILADVLDPGANFGNREVIRIALGLHKQLDWERFPGRESERLRVLKLPQMLAANLPIFLILNNRKPLSLERAINLAREWQSDERLYIPVSGHEGYSVLVVYRSQAVPWSNEANIPDGAMTLVALEEKDGEFNDEPEFRGCGHRD